MKKIAEYLLDAKENNRVIRELKEFLFNNRISYRFEQMLWCATEDNNRPSDFSEPGLPLIAYFFQQGGKKFFKNLKAELKKMPKDKKAFLEQYEYLKKEAEPEILRRNNNSEVGKKVEIKRKKTLVFYFRYRTIYNWRGFWQGSDLLQSAMMIEDLVALIQQNRLSNFDKLVVVPRFNDALPLFVLYELNRRFNQEWVDEHLEMTNEYHKYDKNPNAYWIELVDGTFHNQNPGILGKIADAIGRSYREDCLICEDIFWPDPDGTSSFINNAKSDTGFGKNQAPTLKAVRESLLNKVIELDELVGRERK